MKDKKKQGKKNRQAGARFELKVRKDLESQEWIVSKWMNNVQLGGLTGWEGKLVSAKHKFRGVGIPMAIGTGFPDFVCFKQIPKAATSSQFYKIIIYEIMGVEVKSNGYLDKSEKFKCKWLLDNNIFSKILIASKGKKRGEIIYKEFKWKDM